jgi:uncharacterized protein YcnI
MRPSPPPVPPHAARRVLGAGLLAAAIVATVAAPASAHVTVKPDAAPKGSFSVFSFAVPNESDTASTVRLEVTFPTDHPIAFVSVQPIPGWTWSATTAKLSRPVTSDGARITEAVSTITWSGGSIGPGEFQLFTVSAGPLPTNTKQIEFKAVQTYSDGQVTRWIESTPKGGAEPEFPAPVLRLVGKARSH